MPEAVQAAGIDPAQVIGIGTDFTACTMVPVLADGTPLCELPEYADRPHAYVKLWKHHAAQPQADRINELAASRQESWLARYGGLISSEWEFAKGLQLLEEDPSSTRGWTTGSRPPTGSSGSSPASTSATPAPPATRASTRMARYPSRDFLGALNPAFAGFAEDKVAHEHRRNSAIAPAG